MTIKFKVAKGELAACTIMEQAAAIWKYYKTVDDVQELVNYLQTAIDSERAKRVRRTGLQSPQDTHTRTIEGD